MLKDTSSLITRDESLVKFTYQHPRADNSETEVDKIVLKVGTQGWVGASVHASTSSRSVTMGLRESDGILVGVDDNSINRSKRMF
jgi:uncharacterized membrane protein